MSAVANVAIHSSQFPENIRRDLLKSLRSRKIAHKFHYDSVKQTQKWLALHQQYSPSRKDAGCRAAYNLAFGTAARLLTSRTVHVIGLGCGGGQKDKRLIEALAAPARIFYTPCDVATAMVLTARQAALTALPAKRCFPAVCDLQTAVDLPAFFSLPAAGKAQRVITFFGMIPNFEPDEIMPKLASLLRKSDLLLFSANLAPGQDYATGVEKILPQYDNAPTRDWLLTFLSDLGIGQNEGQVTFGIETGTSGLKRITAHFKFQRKKRIIVDDASITFEKGESIRLFFSCRYTPKQVQNLLAGERLNVCAQWISDSEEEGIFLCRKR